MATKQQSDFASSKQNIINQYNTESILSDAKVGVAVFRINEKGADPLFINDALKRILGIAEKSELENARKLFPGQIFFDRSELRREIYAGNTVEFTTRFTRDDGSSFVGRVDIIPNDIPNRIFNVLLRDIEDIILLNSEPTTKVLLPDKKTNSAINEHIHRWHDKRYRLLLEDESVYTFDYDCETDLYTYYGVDDKGSIFFHETKDFIKNIKLHKKTKIDPNIIISQNIEEMLGAPTVREFDLHSNVEVLGYRWYSCKCKSIADDNGRVRRVVGWFNDITSKQKEHAKLADMAEKDGLTGVLNRASMERYFEEYFAKENIKREGMLFFIDFDKFKYINDTYGHLAGDEILRESTKAIQKVLRKGDLFCRYGGDEFVVFIDKLSDIYSAEKRAKQIIDAVSSVIVRGEIVPKCSVGFTEIWATDKAGHDAIKRADTALLHAKKVAAGSYVYYGKRGIGSAMVVKRVDKDKTVIVEKESLHDNDFFAEMFYLLFSAKNENEGLNKLLEHVGKRFNVSRTYIFEMIDSNYARNTFEWCNKDIEPVIDMLQNVNVNMDGQRYEDSFDSDGVFYSSAINELDSDKRALLESQGIKTTLQYLIIDNGKPLAMMGYDDCTNTAAWTQEQIDGLVLVSRLAAIFISKSILKKQADKAIRKAASKKKTSENTKEGEL